MRMKLILHDLNTLFLFMSSISHLFSHPTRFFLLSFPPSPPILPLIPFHLLSFSWPLSRIQMDLKETRPVRQYKNFQIEVASEGYRLYGTETLRPNLKELLEHLEGQSLRTDNLCFQLLRCCPPQPRGKLDLVRRSSQRYSNEAHGNTTKYSNI